MPAPIAVRMSVSFFRLCKGLAPMGDRTPMVQSIVLVMKSVTVRVPVGP